MKDGGSGDEFRAAQQKVNAVRDEAGKLSSDSDTNYIFLSFVTRYLPRGLVGLILGVIFTAAMSASSGEINSLATVSMIDVYQRHFHRQGSDRHFLLVSRVATVFWGLYAVAFANFAQGFGALIEAVNQVGSLFYGSMLGVFVVAFFMKRAGGTAAFWGVLAGQATTFAVARFTPIAYLWYNLIGCVVVLVVAWAITAVQARYTIHMRRTNLVLDGEALEEARRALGTKTYSETVNHALADVVRRHKMQSIVQFFGKGLWKGDLSEMRDDQPRRRPRRKAAAR